MFDIDINSRTPIYEQLYRKVIELIIKGVIGEGDKLPSVRALALDLHVNANTIQKAYTLLERDGIIYSLTGRGSFIAKPDHLLAQEYILGDFDKAVTAALQSGITSGALCERIDTIAANQGGDSK
ncbi:MAG: GntR family transcriptional regulator [Oscillospiraceae bacterium]|nr:GntR family transcriptional regulator [Oscillospiraceae bacterium]MBR1899137.1 GntR family transcriptional regulator [Oscillospiraceae bacterium]